MSSILQCEKGKESGCGECVVASLYSIQARAEVADIGGLVLDKLPPIVRTGEIDLTGAVLYGAFRRVVETRGIGLDLHDEGFVFDAVRNAHVDRSCISG